MPQRSSCQATKRVLATLLTLLTIAGCVGRGNPPAASPPPPSESNSPIALTGHKAPEITGIDIFTKEPVSLSNLAGTVVVVNFWATWCEPCKKEMPDLQTLQKENGSKLKVIAVGADSHESAADLERFAQEQKLSLTVVHDKGMGALAYSVLGIPTSFFVDAKGIIRVKRQGILTLEQMRLFATQAANQAGQ